MSTMQLRNRPDNGQSESATRGVVSYHAIEALKNPLTLLWSNARSIVAHNQFRDTVMSPATNLDTGPIGRISDRIVDEVAYQDRQEALIAGHAHWRHAVR